MDAGRCFSWSLLGGQNSISPPSPRFPKLIHGHELDPPLLPRVNSTEYQVGTGGWPCRHPLPSLLVTEGQGSPGGRESTPLRHSSPQPGVPSLRTAAQHSGASHPPGWKELTVVSRVPRSVNRSENRGQCPSCWASGSEHTPLTCCGRKALIKGTGNGNHSFHVLSSKSNI